MEKITRESRASNALKRWMIQYPDNIYGEEKQIITEKLRNLGKNTDPDEIDKIIGNRSWTSVPACSECGKQDAPFVIRVGQEPDYESLTAFLCENCIKKALTLTINA